MSLPLPVFGIAYTPAVIALVAVLYAKGLMSRRLGVIILALSTLVTGFILGGLPNPILPIQQIVYGPLHGHIEIVPIIGLGVLFLTVLAVGRIFCGYVCPLGTVQELLSRIRKKKVKIDRRTAWMTRLGFLAIFLIAGAFAPFYLMIDPFAAFTLKAGIVPVTAFIIIAVASVFIYRPWCTLLCPFGTLADIIAKFSIFRLKAGKNCERCGRCVRRCPAGHIPGEPGECIYCGTCAGVCRRDAVRLGR
jgi:polyferredoxin